MNGTEADNTRAWNCQLVFICGLILINFLISDKDPCLNCRERTSNIFFQDFVKTLECYNLTR